MKLDRTKLQRARELLGYGIEITAEKAGVSKNSVLRAEHEEDIRPVTARKIAAALQVEVRDLLQVAPTFPKAQSPLPLEEWAAGTPAVEEILFDQPYTAENFEEVRAAAYKAARENGPQAPHGGLRVVSEDDGERIRVRVVALSEVRRPTRLKVGRHKAGERM